MLRRFIFRGGDTELTLPVTPDSYTVSKGQNVETVNIHELGDVNLAGGRSLGSITIQCLLPSSSRHPYVVSFESPDAIRDTFTAWMEDKEVVRFIVSGTPVNEPVLVERLEFGERDGTNDCYATLVLRCAPALPTVQTTAAVATSRPVEVSPTKEDREHLVVYGEWLCAICRKYYGDGSLALATKLSLYNGRSDPNILYAGETIRIPDRSKLG